MAKSKSFDEVVAKQMQDPEFAKQTLLTSIEEFDESVEEALKYSIELMGIKEFSELSGVRLQNVSDFVKGRKNLKQETLDKYLAPFGLKSKIVVIITTEEAA